MRLWLKPCPRCRSAQLVEKKDDRYRAVRCMQCGYILLLDEIRFLIEDIVLSNEPALQRTTG